jgi:uncharacterized protein
MALIDDVNRAITVAMKARDQATLSAIRMLKTALVNREVERGHQLDEAEALQVVTSLVKQRRESIEQFRKGAREDLVQKESSELAILERLLPPPVPDDELERAVEQAVEHTGATSFKDLGKVMKEALGRLSGRHVDAKRLNELVRRRLTG